MDKRKIADALKRFSPQRVNQKVTPIGSIRKEPIILPNFNKGKAPESNKDLANKKYVDDNAGGVDWEADQTPKVIHANNYVDNNTTYVSSDFTHDDLTGFVANEHLDWTTDRGATNIHANNYTDTNTQLSQENVEDYAGALIANASGTHTGISVTYQDATGDMDLVIDHDTASNFVANEHIDHTGITLTAGTNMTGGGTIAANRTFNVALTTGTNVTGDHGTAATDQVVNVCYGTGDPPAANTTTEGALFVKYIA